MLQYRKGLKNMPAYDGTDKYYTIKVNANECNMAMPPLVNERVMNRLASVPINRYPGEEYYDLTGQIAKNFGLRPENVFLGNGSSELIEKIFYCFGGSKAQKIVFPDPSFSMYYIYAQAAQATAVPVPLEADFTLDLDKFVTAINDNQASLAVLCNPNNPTGGVLSVSDIQYILDNIKTSTCFLLDEAYVEFYGRSATGLLKEYPNLIVARTFSKAYGLAGARVGYMLASQAITEMIGKSFMPYHMNSLSLAVADICYQMRQEFVPHIQIMISERKRMAGLLKELPGFAVYPSETNFLLVHVNDQKELVDLLEKNDIGVRFFSSDNKRLKDCIRISMGTREENDTWYGLMKAFAEGRG
ncbi:MAG: histidinol-phosphate transaminase [Selenomonadaceae bacterium]|nr:histidinol-phosphate transaminase [Selenomonadaceae bacterium]MDD7056238.1 histidinol-phosphate transaminase [Selenomonadaceae bacterium]MDY3915581.1 histidinol-phosphate transaminase [Selenomonadaceae bacterium]